MSTKKTENSHPAAVSAPEPEENSPAKAKKLILFTQGGKGGTGKTTLSLLLLDYYARRGIKTHVIDFDEENRENSGLCFFWPEAQKVSITRRDGLDAMIRGLEGEAPVVFADMGARSGEATFQWMEDMADAVKEFGAAIAAIGIVTDDVGSVTSVLEWGKRLKNRARHIVVLNKLGDPHAEFSYWHGTEQAETYRQLAKPAVLHLESISPDLQNALRNRGETLGAVADKRAVHPELQKLSWVLRSQAVRRRMDAEFDREIDSLLP